MMKKSKNKASLAVQYVYRLVGCTTDPSACFCPLKAVWKSIKVM